MESNNNVGFAQTPENELHEEVILTAGINPVNAVAKHKTATEIRPISQKQAVYDLITKAIYDERLAESKSVGGLKDVGPLKDYINKYVRKEVRTNLFNGFRSGVISLKTPKDDKALKKYCSSVLKNWLDKDLRYDSDIQVLNKLYNGEFFQDESDSSF